MLFLVGLPLGSWYYLREGYQYRKALLDDLRQLGKVAPVEVTDVRDSLVAFGALQGKVLVVGPVDPDNATAVQALQGLSDQFGESGAVAFALIGKNPSAAGQLEDLFAGQEEKHPGMYFFIPANAAGADALLQSLSFSEWNGHTVALADTSLMIRRTYDLTLGEDVKRLVEHLTIVIPSKRTPKPVVKRAPEK